MREKNLFPYLVRFSFFISFDFCDWNYRRIARTTGKLEQRKAGTTESWNDQEAERLGKPERPRKPE
jgi:hypothetical protein